MPNEENTEITDEMQSAMKKRNWKFRLVFSLIALGFIAVIIKLFMVQVVDADKFRKMAKRQQEAKVPLRAERGDIYDRNGKLLVSTLQGVSIAVDPTLVEKKEKICASLEKSTGVPAKEYLEKINSAKGSFVWLARGLMPGETSALDTLKDRGLIKIIEARRNYLYAPLASQIIGCTGIDNKGLSGIELGWDTVLSGTSGYMIMKRDGKGNLHPSADLPVIKAEHGKSLTLTIDIELQRIVEYELSQAMTKTSALNGTVIALEPSSGEILAIASYPTFSPYKVSSGSHSAMRNISFTDTYEPGSTFKLITASAALDMNLINPGTMVDGHNGLLDFGKYQITDDHAIGKVTFAEALEKSSNIVFSSVGNSVPDNEFYKYIRDFGFGNTLGIDAPGEVPGRIRRPKEMTPVAKRYMSFGYGIAVTPLQLISAYATIANNGELMKPFLVKNIFDYKTNESREIKPEKIRRVVKESTAKTLKKMLTGVVENGTGKPAKIDGVMIAGKTGTSQKLTNGVYTKSNYFASFIGFFPADNPRVVLLVLLDNPQGAYYGGAVAAPVFRNIAVNWLSTNRLVASNTSSVTQKKGKDSVYCPNFVGMFTSDAHILAQNYVLMLKSGNNKSDSGHSEIIITQNPKSGTKLPAGSEIMITTAKSEYVQNTKTAKANPARPDVRGLSMRRAINILHFYGIKVQIRGRGIVSEQIWTKESGVLNCILVCTQK